ncbi:hypothetical protein HNP84_002421 [Thermocatellispora tengchongensis]|uniref:Subtilisin inhibitor domain-containing protein n=1 Tax=Thermocatellispora tengchongensis TaxID=1073253 RepID=A0A840P9N2_9ACTN|nr:SSI family serine proteinase inhibitor [Thermocatellispora tengchongensis]MBB5132705.1 hypothetical protein [Thermocatellispora tengchongensis]
MRRLTRPAILGPALLTGMTLTAAALAAAPANAASAPSAPAVTSIPFPPGEEPAGWPRPHRWWETPAPWWSAPRPAPGWPVPNHNTVRGTRQLVLTITPGRDSRRPGRQVVLSCAPFSPGHPNAVAACAELSRSGGLPGAMRTHSGLVCTHEYNPVTASASGTWDGRYIRYQHTFSNMCRMHAATGAVYRF